MKEVIGTTYKPEGDHNRLHKIIHCTDCGYITYERRSTRVQKALQAGCRGCAIQSRAEADKLRRDAPSVVIDGRSKHPLYSIWRGMLERCHNPNHKSFHYYGGRGITVCDEWKDDFWMFVYHVGERPEGHTLDRVDSDYIYCPENVRWATHSQQMSNRRSWSKK